MFTVSSILCLSTKEVAFLKEIEGKRSKDITFEDRSFGASQTMRLKSPAKVLYFTPQGTRIVYGTASGTVGSIDVSSRQHAACELYKEPHPISGIMPFSEDELLLMRKDALSHVMIKGGSFVSKAATVIEPFNELSCKRVVSNSTTNRLLCCLTSGAVKLLALERPDVIERELISKAFQVPYAAWLTARDVVLSLDDGMSIFDVRSSHQTRILQSRSALISALSAVGNGAPYFFSGTAYGSLACWDKRVLAKPIYETCIGKKWKVGPVTALDALPQCEGRALLFGMQGGLVGYGCNRRPVLSSVEHRARITALAHYGSMRASAGDDEIVSLYGMPPVTGQDARTFSAVAVESDVSHQDRSSQEAFPSVASVEDAFAEKRRRVGDAPESSGEAFAASVFNSDPVEEPL